MNIGAIFPFYFFGLIFAMYIAVSKIEIGEIKGVFKNKRLKKIKKLNEEELLKREFEKELKHEQERQGFVEGFIFDVESTLDFINLNMTIEKFLILSFASGLAGFAFAVILFRTIYIAIFGFVGGFAIPYMMIVNMEGKIIKKANEHTTMFLSTLRETSLGSANALEAIEMTLKTLRDPMKTLIKDCVNKARNSNIPIEQSIKKLGKDLKNDYMMILAMGLKKQKESGTSLREYLNSIYMIIESDEKIRKLSINETKYGLRVYQILLITYTVVLTMMRLVFKENYYMLINSSSGRFTLALSMILIIANGVIIYVIRKRD